MAKQKSSSRIMVCAACGREFVRTWRGHGRNVSCSRECLTIVHALKTSDRATRFWSYVDKRAEDECWLWTGHLVGHMGYGRFMWSRRPRRSVTAHRAAYMLAHKIDSIPKGMLACHSCDNPRCCNPAHIWLGDNAQNMADMVRKGRACSGDARRRVFQEAYQRSPWPLSRFGAKGHHSGESNPRAKLSLQQGRELLAMLAAGESRARIAAVFNVSLTTVWKFAHGLHWVSRKLAAGADRVEGAE